MVSSSKSPRNGWLALYVPAVSTLRTYRKGAPQQSPQQQKGKPVYQSPYRVDISSLVQKGNQLKLEDLLLALPEKYHLMSLRPIVLYPHNPHQQNKCLIVRFRLDQDSVQNQKNAQTTSTCGPLAREILGKNRDQFNEWNQSQGIYHSSIRYIQGMYFIVGFSSWKTKNPDCNIVRLAQLTPAMVHPLKIKSRIGHATRKMVRALFCPTEDNPISINIPEDHFSNYGSKPGQGILAGYIPEEYEELNLVRSKVMFEFQEAGSESDAFGFCVVRFEKERDYEVDLSPWLSKELDRKNSFFKKWNREHSYFSKESIPYVKGVFILIQYDRRTSRTVDYGSRILPKKKKKVAAQKEEAVQEEAAQVPPKMETKAVQHDFLEQEAVNITPRHKKKVKHASIKTLPQFEKVKSTQTNQEDLMKATDQATEEQGESLSNYLNLHCTSPKQHQSKEDFTNQSPFSLSDQIENDMKDIALSSEQATNHQDFIPRRASPGLSSPSGSIWSNRSSPLISPGSPSCFSDFFSDVIPVKSQIKFVPLKMDEQDLELSWDEADVPLTDNHQPSLQEPIQKPTPLIRTYQEYQPFSWNSSSLQELTAFLYATRPLPRV